MTAYITTPIYYVNAQPHLGHAYTTIVADTYSRFRALCGDRVRFQTGTDEHGDKIVEAAQKDNKEPKEYVDAISTMFQNTWDLLKIHPDNFIRTTDRYHVETVQRILQQVYDNGDIYFDKYSGLYCKGCERFLMEKELVGGNCPDHQVPPQEITEQNYFFRMSKYQERLIAHIHANPEFITPERYRNEVLSFLSEPLEDLCISRPVSRLTWGIPLPFDTGFVTYVWFDALINYISGIGYPDGEDFREYWPVAEHLIAKDILKPHAIYWPTMLMAIGIEPYAKLHVHGYWNIDNAKMSKSIGNVVRPAELVEEYGRDALRYFILREMSFGLDASFGHDAIIARKNSDLANDLGNLFSRSLTMLQKYREGKVPAVAEEMEEADEVLVATAERMLQEYQTSMMSFQFHKALQSVWELVAQANKYIVINEPWALVKVAARRKRLDTVLYNLVESLRLLALVLTPVMPETAAAMIRALGLEDRDNLTHSLIQGGFWGAFPAGRNVSVPEPLFPRVEVREKKQKKEPRPEKASTRKVADDGLITFEQLKEIDLRVAEVLAAEKIEQSDKLLLLTVFAHEQRTVVAGIAKHYEVEDLIGKKVILVANMKPAKIMGYISEGMLLAAKSKENSKERLELVTVNGPVKNGSIVA
ncbi:MAG: methionine--tRNA ligase [Desulfopila sp.]|jgi:methionyl-tRNA synthetase|nr:methionine--tRNA ligase [Desulfopila sp.]